MFIHIGSRRIVSDREIIGIFNVDTLRLSSQNEHFLEDLQPSARTIVVDSNNSIITSIVSPYTVTKRTGLDDEDLVWRRGDDD